MNELTATLKGLGDGTRFKIVNLLLTHDLCVGALAYRLGLSKAAVSQHLRVLRQAGLVKGEKRGYWTHYAVERGALRQMAEGLTRMAGQEPRLEDCGHDREQCSQDCGGRVPPIVNIQNKERGMNNVSE